MNDRAGQAAKERLLDLDSALREKAKRWFAEAREQTKRDDEDIAAWNRRRGGDEGGGFGWLDAGSDGGGGD